MLTFFRYNYKYLFLRIFFLVIFKKIGTFHFRFVTKKSSFFAILKRKKKNKQKKNPLVSVLSYHSGNIIFSLKDVGKLKATHATTKKTKKKWMFSPFSINHRVPHVAPRFLAVNKR